MTVYVLRLINIFIGRLQRMQNWSRNLDNPSTLGGPPSTAAPGAWRRGQAPVCVRTHQRADRTCCLLAFFWVPCSDSAYLLVRSRSAFLRPVSASGPPGGWCFRSSCLAHSCRKPWTCGYGLCWPRDVFFATLLGPRFSFLCCVSCRFLILSPRSCGALRPRSVRPCTGPCVSVVLRSCDVAVLSPSVLSPHWIRPVTWLYAVFFPLLFYLPLAAS